MIDCKVRNLSLLICCVYFASQENVYVVGKTRIVRTTIMGTIFSLMKRVLMADEEPEYQFPDTLEEFGYYFNEEGQMRSRIGDEPFKFAVRENDPVYNQKHYNALGELITEEVYQLLERECKLQRVYTPANAEENEPKSFVFISEDFSTNKNKLMILIHGNGVVRAGQWARRLIINDCLDSGTQMPYIKWAMTNGYAVIVANPNLNHVGSGSKPRPIKGNSSPEEHTETMWQEFVQKCPASHVAIVAHSYGGVSTVELTKKHLAEFQERVFAIAFTDSVHTLRGQKAEPDVVDYYKQCAVNWASAYDPLDAPLENTRDEVVTVSAGTDKHENTSFSSMESIFKYFTEKYDKITKSSMKDSNKSEKIESEKQPIREKTAGDGEESKEMPSNQNENSNIDIKEPKSSETQESTALGDSASVDDVKTELKSEL